MILDARKARLRDGPAVRREILNALRHEPGLTKSQLCRRLNLSWGGLWHHVRKLEAEGDLVRKHLYGWTGLYASSTPRLGMVLLPLLRDEASLWILGILRDNPWLRVQDITNRSRLSRKQVQRRLGKLHAAGILDRTAEVQARFCVRNDLLDAARRQLNLTLPLHGAPEGERGQEHGGDPLAR